MDGNATGRRTGGGHGHGARRGIHHGNLALSVNDQSDEQGCN